MNKRYQVFISSTFADLEKERNVITQTLMEMDCIPVGMEIFPAIDQEQFDFIKTVIDDSDYYILIIGGRYGSISPDGISYTEMEYNYAVEKGKKIIALLHGDTQSISQGKSEQDPESKNKLIAFRTNVSKGRLVKYWKNADELAGVVALSLQKTIRLHPAIGWVRGNTLSDSKIYEELNELRKENDILKFSLQEVQVDLSTKESNLAGLKDIVTLTGNSFEDVIYGNTTVDWKVDITWEKIFEKISPYLMTNPLDKKVKQTLSAILFMESPKYDNELTSDLDDQNFQTVKIHLRSLGLIELVKVALPNSGFALTWELTPLGTEVMMNLRSVKKSPN